VDPRRLSALGLLVGLSLCACAGPSPGLDAAQAACRAYADTGRHQTTTTLEGVEALRAEARDQAERAAAEDDAWAPLQSDIHAAYTHQASSADAGNAGDVEESARELEAYFAADDRVRADCADADEEIGPLLP
jgi:hypothetical protein